jgi:pyruvate/2-oxoglutarate dehydrogenase complex dihydrolipoamide dehydrogenase (E3) component
MDGTYDLVVIGCGPAEDVAAQLAAPFGGRVLIVERNRPGGVVTTTGGAPTKALREAALYLTGYRQVEVYCVRAAAPLEAGELAGLMADEFQRRGVQLVLGAGAEEVRRVQDQLNITLSTGSVLTADAVLFAAGRMPSTEGLGLEQAGVRLGARGRIVVDRYYRTTAPGIYVRTGRPWPRRPPRRRQRGGVPHPCTRYADLQLRLPRRNRRRSDSADRADGSRQRRGRRAHHNRRYRSCPDSAPRAQTSRLI